MFNQMEEMKKISNPVCFALLLTAVIACVCSEFVQPPPFLSLRSFTEEETQLPCEYKPQDGDTVIQVTWSVEKSNGIKEQVITRHVTEGLQEFPSFAGRVRFASSDAIKDSTLLILSTKESDQATYTCHIATFPSGNFDRKISLTVWRIPISTLDSVILQEGQTFRVAATCRAVGLPPPRLSWDTDVPGKSQNRSSGDGVVTSLYSLHPLRGMNGRNLDCLVWHPALERPRRLSNKLVVHFPPDAMISGYDQSWSVNQKGAELTCKGEGNPQPHNFTWTRKGGILPKDVSVEGNRLIFTRPLNRTDEGVYECEAKNSVGSVKTEINVQLLGVAEPFQDSSHNYLLVIVGIAAVALVVVMTIIILLVTCHHKRRTKELKKELTEKKEEINNLSRQNSIRRLNSVNTDPRIPNEECVRLRMESFVKSSNISLEANECRYSDCDSIGRPALYRSYSSVRDSGRWKGTEMERQYYLQREASFGNDRNTTLDLNACREQGLPHLSRTSGVSREESTEKYMWEQREGMPEGEEGDRTSNSCQHSEGFSNHFNYSNGTPRSNIQLDNVILQSRGHVV
ncbi:nectin-4 isoform X2 [Neoarius graeffei]|uniref:nectin-4 isoform X2 n=1 Tax=Neoarius graeffei TaxID=443677 RepID=UPI00298BCF5D|nr:nectin-4 isoform X2 [Neoarius graeffei]